MKTVEAVQSAMLSIEEISYQELINEVYNYLGTGTLNASWAKRKVLPETTYYKNNPDLYQDDLL